MEMGRKSSLCEYFVVMGAPSTVRVKAIADHIDESMKQQGHRLYHKEGYAEALWVLMDYGDIVAHIFHQETRRFYGLEHLWGDVPKKPYLK